MNFLRKLLGQKPAAPNGSSTPSETNPSAKSPAEVPLPPTAPPAAAPTLDFRPVPASVTQPPKPPSAPDQTPSQSFSYNPDATSRTPAPAPQPSLRPAGKIELTLLAVEGPVWLPPDSPAIELFPAKGEEAPHIAFLGGSAELPPDTGDGSPQRAALVGATGRLSRALPLYLSEHIELNTPALTSTLIAWVVKPNPGFILGGAPWEDPVAAHHARQAGGEDPADYLVVCHLRCTELPWQIELRLVRTIDATCLGTVSAPCPADDPGAALPALCQDLLALLATHLELATEPRPEVARAEISPASLTPYLVRLEQLLAVRTSSIEGASQTLRGERDIIEGQLRLCLDQPASVPARLLLAHTLRALKKVRPAVLAEFQDRAGALQSQHPLPEPAHSVTDRVLADAFTA